MTYSATTEIRGQGVASAAFIDAWLCKIGEKLAKNYAPDSQYKEPPPVGEAIRRIAAECGYNSDLIAAQICKESAGWQSAIVRDKNNPSGLGAVNDNAYAGAVTFASPEAGIRATVAHLRTYVEGEGHPWWDLDPRATAVPRRNLGAVRVLSDLDGKWAYPGKGYGSGIASLANDLVTFAGQQQEAPRVSIPIRVAHATGPNLPKLPMVPKYITVHETANTGIGANAEMHRSFVENGGGSAGVSFHYCVDDHEVVEIESPNYVCWHAGDGYSGTGNRESIAIETCVNSDGNWAKTVENLAALVQTLMDRYGIAEDSVVQHNHWSGKNCPTNLRHRGWNEFKARIAGQLMTISDRLLFPETGKTLQGGFLAYWRAFGGIEVFGFPITEEIQENGMTVQYFERARFEWHPGEVPDRYDVMLGRVGAELLEAKSA